MKDVVIVDGKQYVSAKLIKEKLVGLFDSNSKRITKAKKSLPAVQPVEQKKRGRPRKVEAPAVTAA